MELYNLHKIKNITMFSIKYLRKLSTMLMMVVESYITKSDKNAHL